MAEICCDAPVSKAPYSPEELLSVATHYVNRYFHIPPEVRQDAIAEFILAAHQAQFRSTSDRGVRSYQFLHGRGAAIRFVREWERFGKHAPVSLDNLCDRAERAWIDDDGELREEESSPALRADTLTPEEILSQRETSQTVQNILAGLPERTQDILEMHAVQKLSYECIGNWLYIPSAKVCRIYVDAVCLLYEGCYCARALAAKPPVRQRG